MVHKATDHLHDASPTNRPSLASVVLASAARFPDRPALAAEGRTLSYREFAGRAGAVARAIAACDPEPGKARAALFAYRSVAAYAGALGILLAGKAYVPLNPRFPAERSQRMLEAADVAVMVVDRRSLAAAAAVLERAARPMLVLLPDHDAPPAELAGDGPHRLLCRGDLGPEDPAPAASATGPGDGAYLLFTSGSTGAPKGVLVTHANALAYLANVRTLVEADENDRFSQVFDLTFDLSVHDMFVCWAAGACLCCVPEQALIAPAAFVREQAITHWFSVPSTAGFMQKFGGLTPGGLPSIRSSLFCGEALPGSLAAAWRAAAPNGPLLNLYGPTEATIAITAARWESDADTAPDGAAPIGRPFPGQRIAVVGADLRRAPDGERGELCLAGSQVTPGYWRAPELTAERFVALPEDGDGPDNRWYRTGDVVSWSEVQGLRFHGRVDRQIKIRGYRVEIGEIETAVRAAAGTELAAAIGWPRSPTQGVLGVVAFVAGARADVASIIAACRARLPDYMTPGRIRFLDTLPLNANGKTDYGALERMMEDDRG